MAFWAAINSRLQGTSTAGFGELASRAAETVSSLVEEVTAAAVEAASEVVAAVDSTEQTWATEPLVEAIKAQFDEPLAMGAGLKQDVYSAAGVVYKGLTGEELSVLYRSTLFGMDMSGVEDTLRPYTQPVFDRISGAFEPLGDFWNDHIITHFDKPVPVHDPTAGFLVNWLGLPYTFNDVEPINFVRGWYPVVEVAIIYAIVGAVLHFTISRPDKSSMRYAGGIIAAMMLISTAFLHPTCGFLLADFMKPCLGFIGPMRIYDIIRLRPYSETSKWTFGTTMMFLYTFPLEPPQPGISAFRQNLSHFPSIIFKLFMGRLLLFMTPSGDYLEGGKIRVFSLQWFGYYYVLGLAILFFLDALLASNFHAAGMLGGLQMKPVFNNPFAATSPREFWSRWNLAIKDQFHKIMVGGKVKSRKPKAAGLKTYNDHLSATDAATTADESTDTSSDPANGRSSAVKEIKGNGDSVRHRNSGAHNGHQTNDFAIQDTNDFPSRAGRRPSTYKDKPKSAALLPPGKGTESKGGSGASAGHKKRSGGGGGMLKKSLTAMTVFAFSGLSHEYINACVFPQTGGATGENLLFFSLHGLFCIAQVCIAKQFPQTKKMPIPIAWMLSNMTLILTEFLFSRPYIRAGFFEQIKAFFGCGEVTVWILGRPNNM